MKNPVVLALALLAAGSGAAQAQVGVSVTIQQPGVYGRIEIGNVPAPPQVVYPQPVIIVPTRVATYQRPVYLYVPPGHQRNWARYCGRYAACGQPVYFVREEWVRERYEEHRGEREHGGYGHDRGDHRYGDGREHGRGRGHGGRDR